MIGAIHPTAHATVRMGQRGITQSNLALIQLIGTPVEGGYLVRKKDCDALDPPFRDRARCVVGKRAVFAGDRVVTVYHASRHKERRLLRGTPERSLRG